MNNLQKSYNFILYLLSRKNVNLGTKWNSLAAKGVLFQVWNKILCQSLFSCIPPSILLPPSLQAALAGSLWEKSAFSFHPLLEDKHQSHLTSHPYSWASYKYLIAADLQLFSSESNAKPLHTRTHIVSFTHTHTDSGVSTYWFEPNLSPSSRCVPWLPPIPSAHYWGIALSLIKA